MAAPRVGVTFRSLARPGRYSPPLERSFADLWHIEAKRVHFVPFCATISYPDGGPGAPGSFA